MRLSRMKPIPKITMPTTITRRGPPGIDHPALQRTEQSALHALHRERAREGGPAPAEVVLQQHDVGAEGVEEQRAVERLRPEAGGNDSTQP